MPNRQTTKISPKFQQLIEKANSSFPSTGQAVMAAYKQALGEGYTPRQAKNVLYENIHFLDKRTIRRYMPNEAKDTEKIRTLNRTVDNSSESAKKQNDIDLSIDADQNSIKLDRQTSLENINSDSDSADVSTVSKMNHWNNSTETILRLQNIILI
jgi:hypothetical protein